jgi:hypothetical protein
VSERVQEAKANASAQAELEAAKAEAEAHRLEANELRRRSQQLEAELSNTFGASERTPT